ncbi:sulfide:quinone oxidoreductase [Ruegeria halocynthiae]|uniref:Sulfide:quinone oxidoreductase n=1 Tax=Ruegeria halocynthiae TaxID=985054 RepID=A0A1H2WGP9_9RHOB|nr:TIGR01244 family sulfur transferase [Ruegeria halocynthiae]SDW79832.1 sulfide:quinone oxidoreductase [Ruegeria halocynthiae]
MGIQRISSKLSVCPQILVKDLAEVKAAGFMGIICNRPDGEGADQPRFAEIEKAANEIGLAALYVPVQSGAASMRDVAAFGKALEDLENPVLAYCGSGMRSASLWSLQHTR